ncbi:very short patch repair endonuclease [Terrihabitans rhizophilus]|uniref:Very short patch repair endonuclease n=1 Tax=Terrihabitans rhizophilus TaxID=3092662 RepID=A0ABU4RMU7_9HYPH|nr:very short patch repair endonuclease [Terrihabitans sp. PJ23]MDX6806157.1 very short patch repair endonuclease [Terrihabitans sp. PJ23]
MDTLEPTERSRRMSLVRSKNTAPEMLVRHLVHGMGYRYRLHTCELPGSPDLVFPRRHKAIFVHGCFWHRHGDPACKLARLPKTKLDFWLPKLERNRARDQENQDHLGALGWDVLIVWECRIKDRTQMESTLRTFLG